jgi:hypothetical protein
MIMDATHVTKNKVTISFEPDELAFLSNAINEALEAIEDWEFQTRTGETRNRAAEIQTQLRKLQDEAQRCED